MTDRSAIHPTGADPGLLNGIAWSVRWQDHERSVSFAQSVLEKVGGRTEENDKANRGRAELVRAWQLMWFGRFADSLSSALEVENCLDESKNPQERAQTYAILGFLHFAKGRFDLAAHAVDRGLSILQARPERSENTSAYVSLLVMRAVIYRHKGDTGRAGLVLGNAEDVAYDEDAAHVQLAVARWLAVGRSFDKSIERGERALELANAFRTDVIKPFIYNVCGQARVGLGAFDEAEADFKKGLELAESMSNMRASARIYQEYSRLEIVRGNSETAVKLNRRAADQASQMQFQILRLQLARECAALLEARNEYAAALGEHHQAWAIVDKCRS